MFGKKKNIAEKMTDAYQKAHAEPDLGRRLLMLDVTEADIQQALKPPKGAKQYGPILILPAAGVGIPAAVGIGSALALTADALFFCGLGGLVVSSIAANIYDVPLYAWRSKKALARNGVDQAKNIIPHIKTLEALLSQIKKDKAALVKVEHAEAFQQSTSLKPVLAAHPELLSVFKKAQSEKPLPVIPTAKGKPVPPKDRQLEL